MHILVIAFTLLNVKVEECPNSARGNHMLALINTTEDYDNIEEAVDHVFPNNLHLFLCITDVMINLLILEL